jgi:hypothetical protein
MAGAQPRTSCISLVKQLEILPAPCLYILVLMYFITYNQENFHTDSSISIYLTFRESQYNACMI